MGEGRRRTRGIKMKGRTERKKIKEEVKEMEK